MPELFLWRTETLNTIHYYNAEDYASSAQFGQAFSVLLREQLSPNHTLIFLCIGSDRATGDSLGPLIGYKLEQHTGRNYLVYGTLESPVHAKNLATVVEEIHNRHKNPYIIAIDASLGKQAHIGYYTLGVGSLKPGAGVGKELLAVGDLFITGIVNLSGLLDRMLLQTTRLHTVMSLADRIYLGIRYGLNLFTERSSVSVLQFRPAIQRTK
ncbi:MAG: spore protease YyaC [Lachnospiraceae bacterium]|nr:spore protease YyaC [Lachnospiraceae bacterium]